MLLENEKAVIHQRGFPTGEVRGNFYVDLPDLSPSSRVLLGQEPDAEVPVGAPATRPA